MLAGTMSAPIIVGLMTHFMMGLVSVVIYAAIFLPVIKIKANFKNGVIFGLSLGYFLN